MREKLQTLPVAVLKEMAKKQGIKGATALRKAELIEALCNAAEENIGHETAVPENSQPTRTSYQNRGQNGRPAAARRNNNARTARIRMANRLIRTARTRMANSLTRTARIRMANRLIRTARPKMGNSLTRTARTRIMSSRHIRIIGTRSLRNPRKRWTVVYRQAASWK